MVRFQHLLSFLFLPWGLLVHFLFPVFCHIVGLLCMTGGTLFILKKNYTGFRECYFCWFNLAGLEQILLLRLPAHFHIVSLVTGESETEAKLRSSSKSPGTEMPWKREHTPSSTFPGPLQETGRGGLLPSDYCSRFQKDRSLNLLHTDELKVLLINQWSDLE